MSLVATEPVRPPSDPVPDDGGAKVESLPFWSFRWLNYAARCVLMGR